MKPSLSVVIPAYNEAGNLEPTLSGALEILENLKEQLSAYEIIVVNDKSTDATPQIAESFARCHSTVRVLHHTVNKGFGGAYQTGLKAACHDYFAMIPGDNEIQHESVRHLFEQTGRADVILSYGISPEVRPWIRRMLSPLWTKILNTLFGLHIRYYNGPCVYRTDILRQLNTNANSFGFMAENLIKSLKRGYSFMEVGFKLQPRRFGKVQAFRLKNVLGTLRTIAQVFWDVRFGQSS